MIEVVETFLDASELPRVWSVQRGNDASLSKILGWLREQRGRLQHERDRYGGVLLRGFANIDTPRAFAAVLEVIAPALMDYVGGSAPRRKVHGRVTTASQLPEHFSLALHQEMAYQEQRPDALALFCEVEPAVDGETPLADARVVTSRLDSGVRRRFEEGGVQVCRALPSVDEPGYESSVPRPWQAVLGTRDRREADDVARDFGWRNEWQSDGSLKLWQQLLPAFREHPRTRERVWANQVHYHTPECMLRWALRDGRSQDAEHFTRLMREQPELLDYVYHANGQRIRSEDAEHVWDVLVQSEIPLRWRRGDVLLLDNVLAMHGRRSFKGARSILVGLIRDQVEQGSQQGS
jgi:alpha-ketoglutarate-dependent taurine dioxygenase